MLIAGDSLSDSCGLFFVSALQLFLRQSLKFDPCCIDSLYQKNIQHIRDWILFVSLTPEFRPILLPTDAKIPN